MTLMQDARAFWYSNIPGTLPVAGYDVSRQDMQTYGGPDQWYGNCIVCQWTEWLSRIKQQNLSEQHRCAWSADSSRRCSLQGNELWTHYHQDFSYSRVHDPALPAPRILCYFPDEPTAGLWHRYFARTCDQWMINLRRGLAQAGQVSIVPDLEDEDWSQYDVLFMQNVGHGLSFPRPPIPIVMYGHDLWGHDYQAGIDSMRPDIFLTPYPEPWQSNYKFPSTTKMMFYPQSSSQFFTRPNTDPTKKPIDLLVIGSTANPALYGPRLTLDEQLRPLADKYNVVFSHQRGHLRNKHDGPTEFVNDQGQTVRYLNKWSEFIGSAKYVTFGRFGMPLVQPLFIKYYECLGSGATPVFPEVPDLARLYLMPLKHYITLDENKSLEQFGWLLSHYYHFPDAAYRGAEWHRENADYWLFAAIEDAVQYVTGNKYPRRLAQ